MTHSVQLDESLWVHESSAILVDPDDPVFSKTQNKINSQRWVFGIIEEKSFGDLVLYFVDDRTASTLQPLIEAHIERGTTVHTDGWKAYDSIPWQ